MISSERRRLEREILEISEAERRRIGREIHEGLGQTLTTIGLLCKAIDNRIPARSQPEKGLVVEMCETVHRAIQQMRGLSKLFFPAPLQDGKIGEALRLLAMEVSRTSKIPCVLEEGESVHFIDQAAAIQVYRIAQEAVHNALVRGTPSLVRLSLIQSKSGTELMVHDNGKGTPKQRSLPDDWGLRLIQYRANALGASLEFQSKRTTGATLRCVVPSRL